MFMSISNMTVGNYRFGGLLVMAKAAKMTLPTVGATVADNSAWYAGVEIGSNSVISGGTLGRRVESVSTAENSFVTSSYGTTTTHTRYIDTPTSGLSFSRSTGSQAVTIGSPSGWSVAMAKGSGTEFDGWFTYIRAKR
jgi:hypothetical protein